MSEQRAFGQVGYIDEQGNFVKQFLRGRDIFDSRGVSVEEHQTNDVLHLTSEQIAKIAAAIHSDEKGAANGVAPLGADGKIPEQYIKGVLADCKDMVGDYDALLALSVSAAALKTTIFVTDASGDPTVGSGWAIYFRKAVNGNADDWKKVMEGESLDIDFSVYVKQAEKGVANGVATLGGDGTIPNAQIKAANTGQKGIAQLSSDTNSDDEDKAATPKAVKTVKAAATAAQTAADTADGKAVAAQQAAATAQSAAEAAQTTASNAATEAAKRDAAFCTSAADMTSKNLKPYSLVLMAVDNGPDAQ